MQYAIDAVQWSWLTKKQIQFLFVRSSTRLSKTDPISIELVRASHKVGFASIFAEWERIMRCIISNHISISTVQLMYINEYWVCCECHGMPCHAMLCRCCCRCRWRWHAIHKVQICRQDKTCTYNSSIENGTHKTMNVIHVKHERTEPNRTKRTNVCRNVRGCALVFTCALCCAALCCFAWAWSLEFHFYYYLCVIVQQVQALKCKNWFPSKMRKKKQQQNKQPLERTNERLC